MIEAPVVSIHIPPLLRASAAGAEEVTVSGETVAEALEALGHEHPAALDRLLNEDGKPRPGVHLYLHGIDVFSGAREGLGTALEPEDVLTLIVAENGG